MKIFKKASAFLLASSLAFGVCASAAEIGAFNKGHFEADLRKMATGTDWSSYIQSTSSTKATLTYEDGVLQHRSKGSNEAAGLDLFGYNGLYSYPGTGDAIYGKAKTTMKFKMLGVKVDSDPATNKWNPQGEALDIWIGHYQDANGKYAEYVRYGGAYTSVNEADTKYPEKAIGLLGNNSANFSIPYGHEIEYTVEIDTVKDTAFAKMVDLDDSNKVLGSVEVTEADNKDIEYFVRGGVIRCGWYFDFDLYELSTDYDAYYVKSQSIDDSTDNIVAKAQIGRNLVDGEGTAKSGATMVVAQYDKLGRMIKLDTAAATDWPTSAPGRSAEKLGNANLTVAKAEGYASAKMFLLTSATDLTLFGDTISTAD